MLIIALVTAAVVVGIVVDGLGSSTRSATRCVGVQSAGFMGGVLTYSCGAKATALCRSDAGRKGDLAGAVREARPGAAPVTLPIYAGGSPSAARTILSCSRAWSRV